MGVFGPSSVRTFAAIGCCGRSDSTQGWHVSKPAGHGGPHSLGLFHHHILSISTRTASPTTPPCPEWILPYNNRLVLIDNLDFLLCIREPDADAPNDRALMYVWRRRGTRRFTRRRPSGRGLRTGKGVHIPQACLQRGWGEGRDCLRCVGGGFSGLAEESWNESEGGTGVRVQG